MKKIFSKIIIGTLVAGFFLLPVSVTIRSNHEKNVAIQIERNRALAACNMTGTIVQKDFSLEPAGHGETVSFDTSKCDIRDKTAWFVFNMAGLNDEKYDFFTVTFYKDKDRTKLMPGELSTNQVDNSGAWNYGKATSPQSTDGVEFIAEKKSEIQEKLFPTGVAGISVYKVLWTQSHSINVNTLSPNTNYFAIARLKSPDQWTLPGGGLTDTDITINFTFSTSADANTAGTVNSVGGSNYTQENLFGCGETFLSLVTGCIVSMFYTLMFIPIATLAELAAKILDFFIYYSTNSSSYTGPFVENGWGVVRDIANIFFIIALLYVAIQTILSMGHSDGKKMIGMIIMMALLINFSLFATRVVIDASNILAKIFYNNITAVDPNGKPVVTEGGEISITVGLVKKFDPQQLFRDANIIPKEQLGKFFTFLVFAIFLMLYMIYIFLSVTMFFVARVISLWIAMIFSPLAFASKTVSFDMGGMGMSKWSEELWKNAFLAPIFIFFLYLIIQFASFIANTGSAQGVMEVFMKTLIPFVMVAALLMKAKEIAVEYSGKMGQAMTKAGGMVAGFAGGAALGGVAMMGRASTRALYSKTANSDELKRVAAGGDGISEKDQINAQRKLAIANKQLTRSFDFRDTGAGKMLQSKTGLNLDKGTSVLGLDTARLKGGAKAQDKRAEERQMEISKTYELSKAAGAKQDYRNTVYQDDKAEAMKKAEASLETSPEEKAAWEEKYRQEAEIKEKEFKKANPMSIYSKDMANKFKKEFEESNPLIKPKLDDEAKKALEKEFEEAYKKGGDLSQRFGLNKSVAGGAVGKAADINNGRRKAYANSLREDGIRNKERNAFQVFGNEFKRGGFIHALKETISEKTSMGTARTDENIVVAVGKGEPANKAILDQLKKMTKDGHGKPEDLEKIAAALAGDSKKEESKTGTETKKEAEKPHA